MRIIKIDCHYNLVQQFKGSILLAGICQKGIVRRKWINGNDSEASLPEKVEK